MSKFVRPVGALVLVILAIAVFFGMKPGELNSGDNDRVASALKEYRENALDADNVYQQQVTNGWVARDLLEIVARKADAPTDERPAALLTLAVLGIALMAGTRDLVE